MPVNPNLNPPVSSAAVHAAIFQAKAPRRGENPDPERGSERVKCVPARTETHFLGALNRRLELELTREPGERTGRMVEDGGAVEEITAAWSERHAPEWRRVMAEKSFWLRGEDDAKTVSGERIEESTLSAANGRGRGRIASARDTGHGDRTLMADEEPGRAEGTRWLSII